MKSSVLQHDQLKNSISPLFKHLKQQINRKEDYSISPLFKDLKQQLNRKEGYTPYVTSDNIEIKQQRCFSMHSNASKCIKIDFLRLLAFRRFKSWFQKSSRCCITPFYFYLYNSSAPDELERISKRDLNKNYSVTNIVLSARKLRNIRIMQSIFDTNSTKRPGIYPYYGMNRIKYVIVKYKILKSDGLGI